jgi:hypothetical protein
MIARVEGDIMSDLHLMHPFADPVIHGLQHILQARLRDHDNPDKHT